VRQSPLYGLWSKIKISAYTGSAVAAVRRTMQQTAISKLLAILRGKIPEKELTQNTPDVPVTPTVAAPASVAAATEVIQNIERNEGGLQRELLRTEFDVTDARQILNQRYANQLAIAEDARFYVKDPASLRPALLNAAYLAGRARRPFSPTLSPVTNMLIESKLAFADQRVIFYWAWGRVEQFFRNVVAPIKIATFELGNAWSPDNSIIGYDLDILLNPTTRLSAAARETTMLLRKRMQKKPSGSKPYILIVRYARSGDTARDEREKQQATERLRAALTETGLMRYIGIQKAILVAEPSGLLKPLQILEDVRDARLDTRDPSRLPFHLYTPRPDQFDLSDIERAAQLIVFAIGKSIRPISDQIKGARLVAVGA
jgi:hypothetical protein